MKYNFLTHQQMEERYQELYNQGYQYPYIYAIRRGKQYLYFVGAAHSNDPADPQIVKIKSTWQRFLDKTKSQKRIVFIEGGLRPYIKNEQDAVHQDAESGLMTHLAHGEGVPIISPEPSVDEEANLLAKKFGKDRTVYYYFARQIPQWRRMNEMSPLDFNKYLQTCMNKYQKLIGWGGYDFSLTHLQKLHTELTGYEFKIPQSKEEERIFYDWSDPAAEEVASTSSRIRDESIMEAIQTYWEQGISIFIVYGSGHAIVMEPAVKELGKVIDGLLK